MTDKAICNIEKKRYLVSLYMSKLLYKEILNPKNVSKFRPCESEVSKKFLLFTWRGNQFGDYNRSYLIIATHLCFILKLCTINLCFFWTFLLSNVRHFSFSSSLSKTSGCGEKWQVRTATVRWFVELKKLYDIQSTSACLNVNNVQHIRCESIE